MPKRSQEYRDARRDQILSAAKRCFVRDGFHETSMQDLFAEAGLSAGAVYRYFDSKDDVILAIAEENLRDVLTLLDAVAEEREHGSIGTTLAAVLDLIRTKHAADDLGSLALIVWAEILRNPTLHARFTESLTRIRTDLVKVVRQHQREHALPADVSAEGLAALLFAIVPGYIVQLTLLGEAAVADVGAAAQALWPS
jgi:AcrR family transcriptional regulator